MSRVFIAFDLLARTMCPWRQVNVWCAAKNRTGSRFRPRPSSITHPVTSPRTFSIWDRSINRICGHIGLTAFYLNLLFAVSHERFKQFLRFVGNFSVFDLESPTFSRWPIYSYRFQLICIPTESIPTAWSTELFQPTSGDLKHFPLPSPSYSEKHPPSPHASASASQEALARSEGLTWEVARHYNRTVLTRTENDKPASRSRQAPLFEGFWRFGVC
jgi:hypothetical protein